MIKKLFTGTFQYTVINMAGALLSFLLNLVVVAQFGESKELENYLILFNLFLIVITLIRVILSTVYVPKYIEMKNKSDEALVQFTNQLLGVVVYISLFLVLLFWVFDDFIYQLIAPGSHEFISDSYSLIYKYFTFYLFFTIVYSYFSAVFIANKKILMGSLYVLFQNAAPLLSFVIFRSIYSIVIAHIVVSGIIFLIYAFNINKFSRLNLKEMISNSEEKSTFLKSSAPVFFSNLITKFISVFEKSIATTFSMGTVVVLDFSYKLISRFVGIVSSGATISSYPVIVESILDNNIAKLNRIIYFSISTVLLVSCSILSVLIVLNQDLLSFVFSIGEMSNISSRFYYPMLLYSGAFIFLNTNDLLRRICFSYGFINFISIMNIIQVILNLSFIIILKDYLNELSIPLSYLLVLFLYHIVLLIKIRTVNRDIKIYFYQSGRINIVFLIFIQIVISLLISRISLNTNLHTLAIRGILIGSYFIFLYSFMYRKIKGAIKNEKV